MKNILLIVMMGMGTITHSQYNKRKPFNINVVIAHAEWQTTQDVTYDGSYRIIDYPMGDVPANIGVCTDVIIRAYRAAGIDLQELVHLSVKNRMSFYYPNPSPYYGGHGADSNIDHRRVRILKKWINFHFPDAAMWKTDNYFPGDIIFWDNWHIGILIDKKVEGTDRYYCVHNIGAGPVMEDIHYNEGDNLEHYRLKF